MQYNCCLFIENDIVFDENVFVKTGPQNQLVCNLANRGRGIVWYNQGGLKNGRRTLKIFWEYWYAREISRFVCNKVRLL